MSKAERRFLSQANILRNSGVPALGVPTSTTNNPIDYYAPQKEKYRQIWQYYDFVQCCSRYKWKNLPNGLTGQLLERMLYYRGSVVGFKFAGRVYILPYVVDTHGLNPYGMPTSVKPLTFNGKSIAGENDFFGENFNLPIDQVGNERNDFDAVLLFDNIPTSNMELVPSRHYLNSIIIEEIVETFARININIVVSNKKILIECKDAKQSEVIQKELAIAFGSDCPFAVITSPIGTQSVQSSSDFNADELFNAIKNYDGIRCFMSGISSKGFGNQKKERLVSGELAGAEDEKSLVLDMGYELRQHFCELCNKKFGTNMSVEKREDDFEEMVDGNGETEIEKEVRL